MNKNKALITAGAVFLSVALAVSLISSQQSNPVTAEQAFTWDCETAEYKPETITITCADGGVLVEKIQWSRWSKEGATGTGIYSENLCEPNCAIGKRVSAPVELTLSNLTKYEEKFYLRTIDISTLNGKDFPWGRADGFQWDVMEFVETTKWENWK
jgi:hypothetical protein